MLGLRILFLNWRDASSPLAGGAETFTEEVGKRLVKFGDDVTILTSAFVGSRPEDHRFGMRVIRRGGKYSVYSQARHYVKKHLSNFDIIIDEINTIPFRIRRVAKQKPVVALIHQLAREIWFYETRFPLSLFGYFVLEPLWLREYRRLPTITVSESTKEHLLKRGFRHVQIVHNGIGIRPLQHVPRKDPNPILIFIGRLVRSKFPEHALQAFKEIRLSFPDAELWILGNGYLAADLRSRATEGVTFYGKVDQETKFQLLRRAHILLVPSLREGWGISVIEANAMGTPAVGYSVPGLKDSILHGVTGFLVQPMSTRALARGISRLLLDPSISRKFATNALEWARKFSWDAAAMEFRSVLESEVA